MPESNGLMGVKPRLMSDWNDFVSWMKDKGYSGNPKMDQVEFSNRVLDEYRSENPSTTLKPEIIKTVQSEILNYREKAIDMHRQGRIKMEGDPGKEYENFMSWAPKTGVDNINGQWTSQFRFPDWYKVDYENRKTRGGYAME